MDVRDDSTSSDCGLDEGVELLVSTDRQLEMSRRDALHLQVLARVAGKFQDFSSQILQNGRTVDGCRGPHPVLAV